MVLWVLCPRTVKDIQPKFVTYQFSYYKISFMGEREEKVELVVFSLCQDIVSPRP